MLDRIVSSTPVDTSLAESQGDISLMGRGSCKTPAVRIAVAPSRVVLPGVIHAPDPAAVSSQVSRLGSWID